MNTEKIIKAITEVSDTMHNGDQVTAYTMDEFSEFVTDQVKNEFGGDISEARASMPEWFEVLDTAKKRLGKPTIILNLFEGNGARDCYCLLDDLDYITLQDYTDESNRAQRLELLRLRDEYKEI